MGTDASSLMGSCRNTREILHKIQMLKHLHKNESVSLRMCISIKLTSISEYESNRYTFLKPGNIFLF